MLKLPLEPGILTTRVTTINGISYSITIKWNSRTEIYSMDIAVSGEPVVYGIPLLIGIDLVKYYPQLGISRVYCINKNNITSEISYDELGSDGLVVIIEDEDLEE